MEITIRKIKKIYFQLFILSLVMIFNSCKVYKLNADDNSWQPYKKGDVLIFEHRNGSIDTISVIKSFVFKSKKTIQPYNINNGRSELNVAISTTNSKFTNNSFYNSTTNNIEFFRISNSQGGKYLGFVKYNFIGEEDFSLPIDEMKKFHYVDNKLGDCYLINEIGPFAYSESIYISVLFSKQYGYLNFSLKDGNLIKLKEFIRNGVNILP